MSILEGLYRLHEQKRCHGNLLHGVWVSEDGNPKFQLKFADTDLDAGFHDGFLKDSEDLKTLVRRAVNNHDEHISAANEKSLQNPPTLDHFYTLYSQFKQHANNANLMRKHAIFLYWAPLFFNWKDRVKWFNLVEKFSKQNFQQFEAKLIYDRKKEAKPKKVGQKRKRKLKLGKVYSMPKMVGWGDRVKALDKKDPIRLLFVHHGRCRSYEESGGIYWICRNALHHYGEYVKPGEKEADQIAMEDFFRLFPEAIPCIFDRLIKAFHPTHSNFQKDLATYLKEADIAV